MPTNEEPSINTGGGAATGNVNTRGGDFTGRDRIAYTINFFGPLAVAEKMAHSPWQAFDWSAAEQAYRESLIRHYGSLRIIGATADAPLDNVFTDVLILSQLTTHRRATIEELHGADPDSFRQASWREERVSGLELIQQGSQGQYPTHFYILGKPGAGKTTFLKYITIQAARHQALARIPIFVSLHEWTRSKNEDLFDFIVSRFAICHVPEAAPFVKLLLEAGRALLLFDGLDEVRHEGQKRDRLTHQLQDFVRQYDRCQHLITCRIAASDYIFQGFQSVEVADFTPAQIAAYAAKWFGSDTATYEFFMQELQKPEQKGVYELCNTPLLLALVCLAFANARAFPPTHAELYEDALDVLLRRWDSSRQIDRDALHPDEKIYRELSTQRKKELFARIAHRTFQKGEYFFRRRDLEEWITAYLATLPNVKAVADLDGPIVLKAIEAQHSILVERAKDIYSFSHLTFQEYFTAHYLKQNQASGAVAHLIAAHLGDPRWREVFLLTASLLSEESANDFFYEMQQGIEQLVSEEPVLMQLLSWADGKSKILNALPKQQDMIRLAYIFLNLTLAREFAPSRERLLNQASLFARAFSLPFAQALDFTKALYIGRFFTRGFEHTLAIDQTLIYANELSQLTSPLVGFDYSLFYAWSYAQFFMCIKRDQYDPRLQNAIVTYNSLLQGVTTLAKEAKLTNLDQTLGIQPTSPLTASLQGWKYHASTLFSILQQRELYREWKFSAKQITKLNDYFAANELLVQCLKVATVTDRQAILDGILLSPVADAAATATPTPPVRTKPWWRLW